jgi:hypothetical protein
VGWEYAVFLFDEIEYCEVKRVIDVKKVFPEGRVVDFW